MKKKIFSILMILFLSITCGVLSACKDRYKDMKFNIQYAYSEDATDWYNGNNGISIFHSNKTEQQGLVFDNGVARIYFKVNISNVNAKYIDDIVITTAGTSFVIDPITVKQGKVFSIEIYEDTKIQTSLEMYETNSNKKGSVTFNVSRALSGITADIQRTPAVMVGSSIILRSLNNITYLPVNTLETGVDYSIESLGRILSNVGTYVEGIINKEAIERYISIDTNGVLSVKQAFLNDSSLSLSNSTYVACVKATSKHHNTINDEISTYFYVYIVDSAVEQNGNPYVPKISVNDEIVDKINLYTNSEIYSSVNVKVDMEEFLSLYKRNIMTMSGMVNYNLAIYVDDLKYDFDSQEPLHGLIITRGDTLGEFTILTTKNNMTENRVKFALEIEGLDFTASRAPKHEKELVVSRRMLAEGITINNQTFKDGDTANGIIYGTTSNTYAGLEIDLGVDPDDTITDYSILIESNPNLILSSNAVLVSDNTYVIKSGERLTIRLKDNVSDPQTITFKTLSTPNELEESDAEYISVNYEINKSVTADKIDLYKSATLEGDTINNNTFIVDARANSRLYAKVYYTGSQLATSTIQLNSNNKKLLFANHSSSIALNDASVRSEAIGRYDDFGKYDVYSIELLSCGIETSANLEFVIADGAVRLNDAKLGVDTVFVASDDSISISSNDRDVTKFNSASTLQYAVVKNKVVDFSVLGRLSGVDTGDLTADVIKDIKVSTNNAWNTDGFDLYAVSYNKISNNKFSLMGKVGSRTQVLTIEVTYYSYNNGLVEESNKTFTMEVAVYDPIVDIDLNPSSREIVYINSAYTESSSVDIKFTAYASNNAPPSSGVLFTTGRIENATQIQLNISDIIDTSAVSLYLKNGNELVELNSYGSTILQLNNEGLQNLLRGNIIVKLNKKPQTFNSITLTFTALRFGAVSNNSRQIRLDIADYIPMDSIAVSGEEIVTYGDNSHYLYMSFLDIDEDLGYDEAKFNAVPYYANESTLNRYDELDYELYRVEQNDDGSIFTEDGKAKETKINKDRLDITFSSNEVIVRADKSREGGLFRLVLVAKDSLVENGIDSYYKTTFSIFVSISDGSVKNKYIINDATDLKNINNGLDKNYQLRNNIVLDNFEPIGLKKNGTNYSIEEFTGRLVGTVENLDNNSNVISTSKYKITLNVSSTAYSGSGDVYAGLFAVLGEKAEISGLDIDVTFNTSSFELKSGINSLNIGAVAGENKGTISAVNVTTNTLTNGDKIQFLANNITAGTVNFGSVVGINSGNIDLSKANVSFNADIETSSIAKHNVGLVVGLNKGEIKGSYLGKSSLNSISYTVRANTTFAYINTTTGNSSINLGGVVGCNESNSINNILIGGRLEIDNRFNGTSGNLGGIVGSILGGNVTTVATLGFDLSSNRGFDVAGIASNASNASITDVRVLSAEYIGGFTALGRLIGTDIVAGIVANANNTTIRYATVESFISRIRNNQTNEVETFYTLNGGTTTAGLVGSATSTTIEKSFVNVNINSKGTIYLTSRASESNTYFVGKLSDTALALTRASTASTYSIVYTDSAIYSVGENTYTDITDSVDEFIAGLNLDSTVWDNAGNYNAILVNSTEYTFPYLVVDGERLMIEKPVDIQVSVDEEYIEKTNSIKLDDMDIVIDESKITDSVIINYHNDPNNPLNNIALNTYNLLDVINLTVLPSGATGGVNFAVVEGSQYAYITEIDGVKKLVLTSVTPRESRIVIRCYSLFNEDLEEYIVLYSQYGLDELIIESSNVNIINDDTAKYELLTFTGANPVVLNINALNSYNGITLSNIFNANIDEYLTIDVNTDETDNKILDIVKTNNSNSEYSLKVSDSAEFSDNATTILVTFTLKFNAKEYFGDKYVGDNNFIDIGVVTLKVTAMKSAKEVVIVGSEPVVPTNTNISFKADLYTGYVNTTEDVKPISITIDNGRVELNEEGKDSIVLTMSGDVDTQDELHKLITRSNVNSIVELFDYYTISYSLMNNNVGYEYSIGLRLKDEHNYRFIENNVVIIVRVAAKSDETKFGEFKITFKPAPLSTLRLANFTATKVAPGNNYINLISSNTTETSIISPGGYGGVMIIYLEPSYSNVLSATLTSSELFVPSLGRNVRIRFEQLVYNAKTKNYETIYPRNEEIDGGIKLEKVSTRGENGYEYTGVIYIHTILEKFSGLEDSIRVDLEVLTSDNEVKPISKTLLTQFIPGAQLSYDGITVAENEYIIQQGSNGNNVNIKIYGYQFSARPQIFYEWVDEGINEDITKYVSYYLSDDIETNADGSFYMPLILNVTDNIPGAFKVYANMSLIAEDGQIISEKSDDLIFHPVKYVLHPNSATLEGVNDGVFSIAENSNRYLDFIFTTDSKADKSSDILKQLILDITNNQKDKVDEIKSLFSYLEDGERKTFADSRDEFNVELDFNNYRIRLDAEKAIKLDVHFSVHYRYTLINGKYELQFGTSSSGQYGNTLDYNFRLNIYPSTTEEHATRITDASGLYNLNEDEDYILMNDIVLENFTPITTAISSLDGNNRVITIKSFAVSVDASEYGLFAHIGKYSSAQGEEKQTILKNVIVDYGQFDGPLMLTNNEITNITFGGLVGSNNEGLIYNCDVMAFANNTKVVNIVPDGSNNVNVTFGGLVGVNNGVITNSRVGNQSYVRITADKVSEDVYEEGSLSGLTPKPITFIVGDSTGPESGQGFVAKVGGFVGENSSTGIIASSYVANTSLISYSTAPTESMTAGFAGENAGNISYSYVKALESTISQTKPYSTGAKIESTTNGSVAGFVHHNSGNINNSYANTMLVSRSTFMSGFVYNHMSGTIAESYSACTFNDKHIGDATTAEQPFVGYENNVLLSNGTLENTYYLIDNDVVIDTSKIPYPSDKDQARALNWDNFNNHENLNNFVFVLSNSRTERSEGVWSYYNNDDRYTILPELANANKVTYSYRYFTGLNENGLNNYANAPTFVLGSERNPYIIRNVKEFNDVMTHDGDKSTSGYFRLINNIDFDSNNMAISTRTGFTLGDSKQITSLEGNGMTISGIFLDVGQNVEESIGLFANIERAYIKNLNLEFTSGRFSSSNVQFAGGLAGKINNSVIMNINLNGSNTIINGKNFAGGLAGIITGQSLIYDITSNVNVISNLENSTYIYYRSSEYQTINNYDYKQYLTHLSYAGGIAGVIDIDNRGFDNKGFNLSYITINGKEMNLSSEGYNIKGDYAGSISGYASRDVRALKLKYNVGANNRIRGWYAVGGLFGVNLGQITASQVTAVEDEQYNYDTEYGKYVIDLSRETTAGDATLDGEYGNQNLLETYNYGGGLVGIDINGQIESSYSKASFAPSKTVGGLIGMSVLSRINYSYAVPFVNVDKNTENVGGLIGTAFGRVDRDGIAGEYIRMVTNDKATHILSFVFSSLLLDNSQLDSISKDAKLDYLVADYDNNCFKGTMNYIYAGDVHYPTRTVGAGDNAVLVQVLNQLSSIITSKDLATLLNRTNDVAIGEQEVLFKEIFSGWPNTYWSFDESKYYPLLLNKHSDNYIEIKKAKDFDKLMNNPNAAYKIVDDITASDMDNWIKSQTRSNFIFNTTFTGILVGGKPDGSTPKVEGLYIDTITPNEDAGMFEETNGATIRNINFIWSNRQEKGADDSINGASIKINGHSIKNVGGVSAKDTNSLFASLNVSVARFIDDATAVRYFLNTDQSIGGFGGIVAVGKNSTIQSCIFDGSVKADLKLLGAINQVNFGGIIGKAGRTDPDEDVDNRHSMSVIASNIGQIVNDNDGEHKTKFELTLNHSADKVTNFNIGGIVGLSTAGTVVSNVAVGNAKYNEEYMNVDFNITLDDIFDDVYVGGAFGNVTDTNITTVNTHTNITISGKNIKNEVYDDNSVSHITSVAGLAGRYVVGSDSTELSMTYANSYTNINAEVLTCSSLFTSLGVGEARGYTSIDQSLFTGKIDAQTEGNITSAKVSHTVAYHNDGRLIINQVMATGYITVGSGYTNKLYTGGFVGDADGTLVRVRNSSVDGKIIPITSEYQSNNEIYLGGMVGQSNAVEVYNSYAVVSIIADGVGSSAIQSLHANALFGESSEITTDNVYYSSDYALFPEDSGHGTNLSANGFGYSWAGKLDNSIWYSTSINAEQNKAPYLISLEQVLKEYAVLTISGSSQQYTFRKGSALNPEWISSSTYNFSEESNKYEFYLLSSNITGNLNFSGELSGVLIAGESVYTLTNALKEVLPTVNVHGALSNLHLELTVSANVEKGLIVGTNEGVIFNSSVQGNNLTISGGQVGLIVGGNFGLVSYCYSSLEVTTLNADTLSGIVDTNEGKILSCYFTGYINNLDKAAAGIVRAFGDSNVGYIYNCYMAGIIENVTNNSFAGNDRIVGKNNYIDSLANVETVEKVVVTENPNDTEAQYVLKTVPTYEMMSANGLSGRWHIATGVKKGRKVTTSGEQDSEQYFIDLDSKLFGYNYSYPVYNFNKKDSIEIINHQLYTGKGSANKTDKAGQFDYIKVPHLGVLSAVQGIANTYSRAVASEGYDFSTTIYTNLNYVLIYDMDGKNYNWNSVGRATSEIDGFITDSTQFNGTVVSHKNYHFTAESSIESQFSIENACTISGIQGSGLFTNIKTAEFKYIRIGKMSIANGGALGNVVLENKKVDNGNVDAEDTETKDADVIVNNLDICEAEVLIANDSQYVGAIFGEIRGKVNITNIITEKINPNDLTTEHITTIKSETNTTTAGGVAGLLAGRMVGGELNVGGEGQADEYKNIYVRFDNFNIGDTRTNHSYASGFIGEMSSGHINGNGITVNITTGETGVDVLAGIVGRILPPNNTDVNADGTTDALRINNVEVKLLGATLENAKGLSLRSFGGFIGEMTGNYVEISNCALSAGSENENGAMSSVTIKMEQGYNYIGLVVANMSKGKIAISSDETSNSKIKCYIIVNFNDNKGADEAKQGFGGYIGEMTGGEFVNSAKNYLDKTTIEVNNGYNLGGIIGRYLNGAIALDSEIDVTLRGTDNVGGAIGLFENKNEKALEDLMTAYMPLREGESGEKILPEWNFLQSDKMFAKLRTEGIKMTDLSNWGGLFGKFVGDLNCPAFAIPNEDELGEEETIVQFISNKNTIELGHISSEIRNAKATLMNVGGVVGLLDGNASHLMNSATISYSESSHTDTNYLTLCTNKDVFAINVGGVIGSSISDSKNITDIYNNEQIVGYQNVGGLIGFVKNATVKNNYTYGTNDNSSDNVAIKFTAKLSENGAIESYKRDDNGKYVLNDDAVVNGNVYGALNVGGAFGFALDSEIQFVWVDANIYGNANVGGLVGYLNNTNITSSFVGDKSLNTTKTKKEVKAIYYAQTMTENGKDKSIVYLPTSVGGFIGIVEKNTNKAIRNNIVNHVKVTSADEGTSINNVEETSSVISTISNLMVNVNNISTDIGDEYFDYIEEIGTNPDRATSFNNLESGFGGFVGTTKYESMNDIVPTNELNVEISAQLGINTGTFYGYFAGNANNAEVINTPKLLANVSVSGAYNIGGVIGFVDGSVSFNVENTKFGKNITVQPEHSGMYVGGLFGKVKGTASDVSIKAEITISSTNSSYYIGGLIGRLEGNMSGAEVYDSIFDKNKPENFGGLVGMLKVEEKSGGTNASVQGTHKFAFTVNTIENSNYYDGNSIFNANKNNEEGIVYLYAQAYYVNQDTFNISGTSNGDYYEYRNGNNPKYHNPLNIAAQGWHKDYTGFRTIQRCIQQNGTWDSIAVIYDAANITHVGTIENLGLDGTKVRHKEIDEFENMSFVDSEPDYICFTVYEEEPDSPTLYSPMGIAIPQLNHDENQKNDDGTMKLYSNLGDGTASALSWALGIITEESPEQEFYLDANYSKNAENHPNLAGLTYFDWGNKANKNPSWIKYDTLGKNNKGNITERNNKTYQNGANEQIYISYFVKDYLKGGEGAGDAKYGSGTGAFFIFQTVYINETAKGLSGTDSNNSNLTVNFVDETQLPRSGSIFDVSGYVPKEMKDVKANAGAVDGFGLTVSIIGWVLTGVEAVLTLGTLPAVKKSLQMMLKYGFKKALKSPVVKKLLKKFLKRAARSIVLGLVSQIMLTNSITADQSKTDYFKNADVNFGYLSSAYTRQITYQTRDGRVVNTPIYDDGIVIDGEEYIFYSYTRPTDWISARYLCEEIGGYETSKVGLINWNENGVPSQAQEEINGLFPTRDDSTGNEDGSGIFKKSQAEIRDYAKITITGAEETANKPTRGDIVLCRLVGEPDDKMYLLYENYTYQQNMYWVIGISGEVKYQRSNAFFTVVKNSAGAELASGQYYLSDMENNYVFGHYEDEQYIIGLEGKSIYPGNLVTYIDNKYSVNEKELPSSLVEKEETKTFKYLKITPEQAEKNYYKEGYGYMIGAYYTPSGTYHIENSAHPTYGVHMHADYVLKAYSEDGESYYDRDSGGIVTLSNFGTEDIDYIISNYKYTETYEENGETLTREKIGKLLYIFDGKNSNNNHVAPDDPGHLCGANDYDLSEITKNVYDSLKGADATLNVRLYPASFKNPYLDKTKGKDLKDDCVYIYSDDGVGISQSVKYYLFEGGYLNVNNTIYTPINMSSKDIDKSMSKDEINEMFTGLGLKDALIEKYTNQCWNSKKMTSYQTSVLEISKTENTERGNGTVVNYSELIDSWSIYQGWYIVDSEEKVSEAYQVKDGKIYQPRGNYTIRDGLLHYMSLEYSSANNVQNYNYNKFLTNSNYQLYTRYKYVNGGYKLDLSSNGNNSLWSEVSGGSTNYYNIIPQSGTSINNGITTYLCERVMVTLNGNTLRFTNKGQTGQDVQVGKININ